ncbi:MAG: selenocysteine-specific translation elongation factor, partial [Thermodesulfobacteriota bacterium]
MHCTIGTAGHVDHGKTTLVKALTGIDTDSLAEEKRRGLTIELGFARMDGGGGGGDGELSIGIIDVPGHEKFIRNMLAGTTGIDMVLFIIAADDGPMPQTLEHLDIVTLLGVTKAVFAVTKIDMVPPERVEQVLREVRALIDGGPLSGAPVAKVSAVKGLGIDELKQVIIDTALSIVKREGDGGPFFRLPIDRSFQIKGFGTVLTGTVASGAASTGDELLAFPSGTAVKVRGLESLRRPVERVECGERAALNLKGVSHKDFTRGEVLATPELAGFARDSTSRLTRSGKGLSIDCAFEFSKVEAKAFPIKTGTELKLFHQTGSTVARIRFYKSKKTSSGERVFGRLTLKEPLLVMRGDRFILRDTRAGRTIGGGTVLLPHYQIKFRKKLDTVDFAALDIHRGDIHDNLQELLTALYGEKDIAISASSLKFLLNLPPDDTIYNIGGFSYVGEALVRLDKLSALSDDLRALLTGFHASYPDKAGTTEAALLRELKGKYRLSAPLFTEVVGRLIDEGSLKRDGSVISLATHSAGLGGE